MTDAFYNSLAPTFLALGTLVLAFRNSGKTDRLIIKADEIHTLTNSAMSKVREDLLLAQKEISNLKKLIVEMRGL